MFLITLFEAGCFYDRILAMLLFIVIF